MKIHLEKYNADWTIIYQSIEKDLRLILYFLNPVIDHIGSTSVFGLTAKPIIDILVGIPNEDLLDRVVDPLVENDYIFYQKYNSVMPYRRFFVKLKTKPENILLSKVYHENDIIPNEINDYKLAHIHILEYNSYHWTRHIAFRDFLKTHLSFKNEYHYLKLHLSTLDWKDGNEYNDAKNDFIKSLEPAAFEWYKKQKGSG